VLCGWVTEQWYVSFLSWYGVLEAALHRAWHQSRCVL